MLTAFLTANLRIISEIKNKVSKKVVSLQRKSK